MIAHILIAVDPSPLSRAAVLDGAGLALATSAALSLLRASRVPVVLIAAAERHVRTAAAEVAA